METVAKTLWVTTGSALRGENHLQKQIWRLEIKWKDKSHIYKDFHLRDAKCGKIQCQSSATKPIGTNAVSIDTTIHLGQRKILCRGTHVYRPGKGEEGMGDTLDPGLVMTGTKCGDNAVSSEYM